MRLVWILIALVLLSFRQGPDITSSLISDHGDPTPALQVFLKEMNMQAQAFSEILWKTQAEWVAIRQGEGGIERRDLVDGAYEERKKESVLNFAQDLQLFSPFSPSESHYKYALCLGAFATTAKERLDGLIDLWRGGVHFEELIFLGGERSLQKEAGRGDDLTSLGLTLDGCHDETDMLKALWNSVQPTLPLDMARCLEGHVTFVHAEKGERARPSTADTLKTWLNEFLPQPGPCLMMSSRGFVHYQYLIGKRVLGPNFPINAVSPPKEADRTMTVKEALDTIAKCIYEINLMNMSISPLSEETLEEAIALVVDVFDEAPGGLDDPRKWLPASLHPEKYPQYFEHDQVMVPRYWVAQEPMSRKVIGVSGLFSMSHDAEEAAWLAWYCVHPDFRGKKVGSRLLDLSIEEARKLGKKYLRLYTSNSPIEKTAQDVYEKRGLKLVEFEGIEDRSSPDNIDKVTVLYRQMEL